MTEADLSDLPDWAPRQAAVVLAMLEAVVEAVRDGRPADRALNDLLAGRKKYGSRDRRLIRDAVFSWFRWHGAVGEFPLPKGLSLAWYLDGSPWPPPFRALLRELGWPEPEPMQENSGLEARRQQTEETFSVDLPPVDAWLPDWWREETRHLGPWIDRLNEHVDRPPTWLRVDRDAREKLHDGLIEDGAEWAGDRSPGAYAFRAPGRVHTWLQRHSDVLEIQDLSSQQVVRVCDPKSGETWWDACCGAGGKSLQLLDLADRNLDLTCTDRREGILPELAKRGRRHGLGKSRRYALDLLKDPELPNLKFDGILVDAPCSGSGTWARNPDGAWRTELSGVRAYASRQLRMLDAVQPALTDSGRLIYAVCSLTRQETIGVVDAFLANHPDLSLDPFPHPLTGADTDGSVVLLPSETNADGMFIARFQRGP